MDWLTEEDKLLRRYLLDDVTAEERQQVEDKLLSCDESDAPGEDDLDFVDRLLLAEDELIDDYARQALAPNERELFEANFRLNAEWRQRLLIAQELVNYAVAEGGAEPDESAEPVASSERLEGMECHGQNHKSHTTSDAQWWRGLFTPAWKVTVYAVLILSLSLGAWWVFFRQSELGEARSALREAYRGWRNHESRVTGFDYAPLDQTRDVKQEDAGYLAREHAEILIRSLERKNPGPASLHLLGQMYLAEKEYDKAIAQLRAAQTIEPNNALICADLGAALLEKARRTRKDNLTESRMAVAGESLDFLTKALALNESLNEARFNRALCFEALENFPKAKEDWESYLRLDSNSLWAREAREHLARINQKSGGDLPRQDEFRAVFNRAVQVGNRQEAWRMLSLGRGPTGNLVVESLIDEMSADAVQQKDAGFQRQLYLLDFAGDLESEMASDLFTKTLARYYGAASRTGRTASMQARALMNQGHARRAISVNEAIKLYKQAGQIFRRAGNMGEAEFSNFHIAKNLIWAGKLDEALDVLQRLSRVAEEQDFLWLHSQASGQLASLHLTRNEFSQSLDYLKRLMTLAEKIGDQDAQTDCSVTIADLHYYLRDYQSALNSLNQAFSKSGGEMPPQIYWRGCQEAALCFASLGLFYAALEYQKQALLLAEQLKVPVITARSHTYLGWIYAKSGNYLEGIKSIQEAIRIGERNQDDPVGENIIAYSSLRLGHLYRLTKQFDKSLTYYDLQVALARKLELTFDNYESQQGRFLAFVGQQNIGMAQEAMQQSLALLEKYRSEIVQEEIKNRFFDTGQDVYDAAIQFASESLGNPQQAFDYSEISRARSLLDSIAQPGARPLTFAEVKSRLPVDTQIVQYAMLDEALVIWVVTPDGLPDKIGYVRQPISSKAIDEKVKRYLRLVSQKPQSSQMAPKQESEELYDLLIKPIRGLLKNGKQICIVPDKSLCYLPFSALLSAETGKCLLEEFVIITAPSASAFIACTELARKKERKLKEAMLVIGDPSFDNKLFPQLDPLDSAREEALQIAAYYPAARVLVGNEATELRVKKAMTEADVIHIAAHGLIDERAALNSALVLAADTANTQSANESEVDGLFHAYEIYGAPMPRPRLVVLSACRSGIESFHRGEGMTGLARPFLVAGVPQVISSQWKVDSIATRDLMVRFHKYRKQAGFSTAQALRHAQQDFLQDKVTEFQHPYYWAAFSAVGGATWY